MRSQGVETVIVARRLLMLGLTVAPLLAGCSAPPSDNQRAADAVSDSAPSAPEQVTVLYQPTQLCPSPSPCVQGDELVWVPLGTTLAVVEVHVQQLSRSTVHWFRVEYGGRDGWITEMSTDRAPRVRAGKIVRE